MVWSYPTLRHHDGVFGWWLRRCEATSQCVMVTGHGADLDSRTIHLALTFTGLGILLGRTNLPLTLTGAWGLVGLTTP